MDEQEYLNNASDGSKLAWQLMAANGDRDAIIQLLLDPSEEDGRSRELLLAALLETFDRIIPTAFNSVDNLNRRGILAETAPTSFNDIFQTSVRRYLAQKEMEGTA